MRRRDFILFFCGAAAWPFAVNAQQAGKLPIIGFLGTTTPLAYGPWAAAFVQRLGELGWIDGKTVAIEYRWAEGHPERFGEIASEFVRLKVDLIFTLGAAVFAAKQLTTSIPIVFAVMGDPVGAGVVASLARPGGNITGLSVVAPDLGGKRLALLRELVPNMHRLLVLGNVGYPPAASEMKEVQAAAGTLGIEAVALKSGQERRSYLRSLSSMARAMRFMPHPIRS